jgi:hypothetical protein
MGVEMPQISRQVATARETPAAWTQLRGATIVHVIRRCPIASSGRMAAVEVLAFGSKPSELRAHAT